MPSDDPIPEPVAAALAAANANDTQAFLHFTARWLWSTTGAASSAGRQQRSAAGATASSSARHVSLEVTEAVERDGETP